MAGALLGVCWAAAAVGWAWMCGGLRGAGVGWGRLIGLVLGSVHEAAGLPRSAAPQGGGVT